MRYNSLIKQEIYKKGYTIESFCESVGINRHTIFNIEKKKHKTRDVVKHIIADGLNISYERVCEICQ